MEHTRIDEGVARGPNKPAEPWPIRKPPTSGKLGPNFDVNTVLVRYLCGEEIAEIAASLNVHPKALNYHLLKEPVREAWREAQVAVSLAEYQEAKEVIRSSPDALSLARAREILRSCQWDLEKLETRLFGIQTHVTVEHVGDLADKLRRARERVLPQDIVDAEIVHTQQPSSVPAIIDRSSGEPE